ncbi:unnamed protein product [Caenorhabditis auriculariae]|uniref:Neurotransmitter-gated ion-channel ligand-binding domain-containing protein n=1 Tax=Caenorhabditis auriculariae TaxID=2777116 RepID=A0A8S1H1P5_9PELO|nr:unnamed protein product [Caenorhabditis auriculariae]
MPSDSQWRSQTARQGATVPLMTKPDVALPFLRPEPMLAALFLLPLAAAQNVVGPHITNSPQALFQARATSSDQLDPCQYMLANLTSVENLMQHEVVALEQCLYYYLAGETAKKMLRLNIAHPIAAVPPNYLSRVPVSVNFAQFTLQHFELNEGLKDIAIHGYLELNWHDDRLIWDKDTWKKDNLVIHSFHHVWVPVLGSQNPENHLKNGDAFEMRKVETTNRGNVTAKLAFSLRTFCDDTDFENYPNDIYKCCFAFEPQNDREVIEFTSSESFDDPAEIAQLGFCLNLKRASSSLRIEFTIPLFIITILFLLPTFFGCIRLQLHLKLFVLLIQFVTLLIFSNRIAQHLSSSSTSPKPLRFLESSMMLNLASIAVSVFVYVGMRVKRSLPPWGKLSQTAKMINGALGVLYINNAEEISMEKVEEQPIEGTYHQDWTEVFKAGHALLTGFFSLILVFAYLIYLF